jgi:hypothetical protein
MTFSNAKLIVQAYTIVFTLVPLVLLGFMKFKERKK